MVRTELGEGERGAAPTEMGQLGSEAWASAEGNPGSSSSSCPLRDYSQA